MDPSYQALTTGCGVADLSSRSRVWLTGADRVQFLNGFCTNDIKRLTMGEGCEAFLTNHQGKTVGHVLVRMQQGDAIVLDSAPEQAAKIIQHLDRFVISDRVDFRIEPRRPGSCWWREKKPVACSRQRAAQGSRCRRSSGSIPW